MLDKFEELLNKKDCKYGCVGKVIEEKNLKIYGINHSNQVKEKEKIIDLPIAELKDTWKSTFGGLV